MTLDVNSGNQALDALAAQINVLEGNANATPSYDARLEQVFAWMKEEMQGTRNGADASTQTGGGNPGPVPTGGSNGSGVPAGGANGSGVPAGNADGDTVQQSVDKAGAVGGPAAAAAVQHTYTYGGAQAAQAAANAAQAANAAVGGGARGAAAAVSAAGAVANAAESAYAFADAGTEGQEAAATAAEAVARAVQSGGVAGAQQVAQAAELGGADAATATADAIAGVGLAGGQLALRAAQFGGAEAAQAVASTLAAHGMDAARAVANAARGANRFAESGEEGLAAGARAAQAAANAADVGGIAAATAVASAAAAGGAAAATSVLEIAQALARAGEDPASITDIADQVTSILQSVSSGRGEEAAADFANHMNEAIQSTLNAGRGIDGVDDVVSQVAGLVAAGQFEDAILAADLYEGGARIIQYAGEEGHNAVEDAADDLLDRGHGGLAEAVFINQSAANAAEIAFKNAGEGTAGLAAGEAAASTVAEAVGIAGVIGAESAEAVYSVGGTAEQAIAVATAAADVDVIGAHGASEDFLHNIITVASLPEANGNSLVTAANAARDAYETGGANLLEHAMGASAAMANVEGATASDCVAIQVTTAQAGELAELEGAPVEVMDEVGGVVSDAVDAASVAGATPADVLAAAEHAAATAYPPPGFTPPDYTPPGDAPLNDAPPDYTPDPPALAEISSSAALPSSGPVLHVGTVVGNITSGGSPAPGILEANPPTGVPSVDHDVPLNDAYDQVMADLTSGADTGKLQADAQNLAMLAHQYQLPGLEQMALLTGSASDDGAAAAQLRSFAPGTDAATEPLNTSGDPLKDEYLQLETDLIDGADDTTITTHADLLAATAEADGHIALSHAAVDIGTSLRADDNTFDQAKSLTALMANPFTASEPAVPPPSPATPPPSPSDSDLYSKMLTDMNDGADHAVILNDAIGLASKALGDEELGLAQAALDTGQSIKDGTYDQGKLVQELHNAAPGTDGAKLPSIDSPPLS